MTTTNPPPPKRRRYDPYGSLSEYGVFPECDAQQPTEDAEAEALVKYQPCGCVICTCEDEQQCQGCGAKHCGNRTDHPPYVVQQPAETSNARREQELVAAAATFCDNCGCSWLDNGLNPVGCPYCKQRKLLTLAEQWERDAAGCRRDGYIDAAVVKEDCAQRIRQILGISAIAEAFAAQQAAEIERLTEALQLAEEHIDALTPEWYSAGQRVLAAIRAAMPGGSDNGH